MGASLRFLADWSHEQRGAIHAGERLRIEYDRTRMPTRPWDHLDERGFPAWSIGVLARYQPGGLLQSTSRWTSDDAGMLVFDLNIPMQAGRVELFFSYWERNREVSARDDRHGESHWFEVVPGGTCSIAQPRADDIEIEDPGPLGRVGRRDIELDPAEQPHGHGRRAD